MKLPETLIGFANNSLLPLFYPQGNRCHLCNTTIITNEWMICHDCEVLLSNELLYMPSVFSDVLDEPDCCASVYSHTGTARELIHRLKYNGDRFASEPLVSAMIGVYVEFSQFNSCDIVTYVPTSRRRKRLLGYNHAGMLAERVAKYANLPIAHDMLKQGFESSSQVHLMREERLNAVKNKFEIDNPTHIKGSTILLIDDVLTTGATVKSCSDTLHKAGAYRVCALTASKAMPH